MSKENHFTQLLDELGQMAAESDTLVKALPQDDDKPDDAAIAAAAEESADKNDDENPEDKEDAGEDQPMAKSLMVDGEEVQVVDADLLIKSLHDLSARVETNEGVLAKGLETALNTLKSQGDLIKSLQGQLSKLGSQGAGRKAVLTITEKPEVGAQVMAKAEDQLTPGDVMAKAHAAFAAGKISGLELASMDVALRSRQQIDPGVLAKALS